MASNIKELYTNGINKIRQEDCFLTGFEELDMYCKYLQKGSIMTIGGRPAMGKTSLSASITNNLVETGKHILFFSLCLSAEHFVQRLVAEKIGTPLFTLLDGRVRQEEVDIVLNSYDDKQLSIIDKSKLTIEEFENKVKEIKPDVVFINYIQLLQMPKAPNLTEATNLAIREVKRIAVENDVIVVLLSQLSRAVEGRCDKHPLLSDLRNGSLLEEISDMILMIYRDGYYNPEPEFPQNEIIVAKNTVGSTGIVGLDFKNGFFKNRTINNTF